jgi:hypothetical protein
VPLQRLHHRDTSTIGSPPFLQTSIMHSIAVTQCSKSCSVSGNPNMDRGASRNVNGGLRPQFNRIVKSLIPTHKIIPLPE